jgi:hypothetical protein
VSVDSGRHQERSDREMTDINTEDWTAKQYMKKSDLELTETCAKWLGYSKIKTSTLCVFDGNVEILTETGWRRFEPLHPTKGWNDLMKKVVPKLPVRYGIHFRLGENPHFWINEIGGSFQDNGKYPDDFPRAVLELVAKLYEAESFSGQMPGGKSE